ncbi:MAG: S8 family serine peptidase, partial [Verrucomicrobiales bacterium]|nr:S8 family serine peptidase [Verrucomicrobiales bacterium]
YAEAGPNFQAWIPGLPPEQPGVDAEKAGGREPFREGALAAIGAVGDRSTWGRGVTVALLDSGVESHPSLEGVKVQSLAVPGSVAEAGNGHGTAMASLIAGREGPGQGVAPAVTLLDVRVADGEGGSNTALLARGILSAVDQGADVINISLGTFGDSRMLRDAVAYAEARHVVVVAAAGNEQADRLAYPAGYPGVVAVAAVDAANQQAYFSNSGQGLTVAAPGVGVVSAYADGKWVIGSGTSQATALTTGVVAVMLGRGSSPDTILRSLQNAAQPTGGQSDQVGAGLVQLPPR